MIRTAVAASSEAGGLAFSFILLPNQGAQNSKPWCFLEKIIGASFAEVALSLNRSAARAGCPRGNCRVVDGRLLLMAKLAQHKTVGLTGAAPVTCEV